MILKEHIIWAISSIVNNKMRSSLSMLWIIIWVFSIIVMMALWQWTTSSVVSKFSSMWANLITVSAWWSNQSKIWWIQSSSSSDLIDDEFLDFVKNISWVKSISPTVTSNKQFIYWTYNTKASIVWVRSVYKSLKNLTVSNWSFITDDDVKKSKKVVVLWYTIASSAFGTWTTSEDPLWKEIKLEEWIYTVVWVLSDNSTSNSKIYAPISTVMSKMVWTHYYSSIDVEVKNTDEVATMKTTIDDEIATYLKIWDDEDRTYSVSSMSEMLSSISEMTSTLTMFLAWIAAISLIVWWIGVMNIMLVSVTERTREIWIRKALWAMKSDIMTQFLIEAMFISVLAWLIGIWLSYVTVQIVSNYIAAVITTSSITWSFSSVVMIWIVFWLLPASKASNLKPIDALRYE